jgi:hypothetical protein
MNKRKFFMLFLFAILCLEAETDSVVEEASTSAVTAAASAIATDKKNISLRNLAWCSMALKENTDTIAVISFAVGSFSVSIMAVIRSLEVFFQTRSEIQLLRHEVEMERQKSKAEMQKSQAIEERRAAELKTIEENRAAELKTMEERRAAELKTMEERRVAELKAMQDKLVSELQAERALRASEVSLARSEAVKEILLLGGTEYYAQILRQILENQPKQSGMKKES